MPREDRAAACLILLYAQPAAKIAALATSDIEIHDGDNYLALEPLPCAGPRSSARSETATPHCHADDYQRSESAGLSRVPADHEHSTRCTPPEDLKAELFRHFEHLTLPANS